MNEIFLLSYCSNSLFFLHLYYQIEQRVNWPILLSLPTPYFHGLSLPDVTGV